MWLAIVLGVRPRVPARMVPGLGRVRLLAPARVDARVRAQLPRPLVPAVPDALPRRLRRLGDRDAEPDHLRARGGLLELPALARRAAQARAPVRVPERAAAADHRPRARARRGRRGRDRRRDRLLLPGPRLAHPHRDPEPRLLPDPGDLPLPHHRRAHRELRHRHRVRLHRPAHADRDAGLRNGDRPSFAADAAAPSRALARAGLRSRPPRARQRGPLLRAPQLEVRRSGSRSSSSCSCSRSSARGSRTPSPFEFGDPTDEPPSSEYWFGTTSCGQDVFSQFVYGLRSSFIVGALGRRDRRAHRDDDRLRQRLPRRDGSTTC